MFWFLLNRQPFLHIVTFLDTCQKMVSTHAPQFRSNLFVAPKLTLIMIANVRVNLCLLCKRRIKFPFCPLDKDYKYPSFLLRQQSPCSTSFTSPPFQEHICSTAIFKVGTPRVWRPRTQESSTPTMASTSEIPEVCSSSHLHFYSNLFSDSSACIPLFPLFFLSPES